MTLNKSLDWIISRTGVEERRISHIDVDKMGAIAAKKALGDKVPDLIINASGVGKQIIPDTSVFSTPRAFIAISFAPGIQSGINPTICPLIAFHKSNNNFGIAVKDKSIAEVVETKFKNNNIQISAYAKNWQYGGGGTVNVVNSKFESATNSIESTKVSRIHIDNSTIDGDRKIKGKTVFIDKDDKKNEDYKILHTMSKQISL